MATKEKGKHICQREIEKFLRIVNIRINVGNEERRKGEKRGCKCSIYLYIRELAINMKKFKLII